MIESVDNTVDINFTVNESYEFADVVIIVFSSSSVISFSQNLEDEVCDITFVQIEIFEVSKTCSTVV